MPVPESVSHPTTGPITKFMCPDNSKTYELKLSDAGDLQINGANILRIKTGTYTGDGATARGITGIGFKPKFLKIYKKLTIDADATVFETSDVIVDDHANGMSIMYQDTGAAEAIAGRNNRIKSLDTDGFTIDDDGGDLSPNKNTILYNWMALG